MEIENNPLPPRPPLKVFKPKLPELQVLKNYGVPAKESYWKKFPANRNMHGGSPYKLNSSRLYELALEARVPDMVIVNAVIDQIDNGCDLAVDESKYIPSRTANTPSVKRDGRLVADALGTWIKAGITAGPFKTAPDKATVCSLQTKPKPTGATRIIVNSSCPRGKSVNDCIDKSKYPAYMGGIKEFIVALNYCGHRAKMCKVDWKVEWE